jgi:hypothetical protein
LIRGEKIKHTRNQPATQGIGLVGYGEENKYFTMPQIKFVNTFQNYTRYGFGGNKYRSVNVTKLTSLLIKRKIGCKEINTNIQFGHFNEVRSTLFARN